MNEIRELTARVDGLERKINALSTSMKDQFEEVLVNSVQHRDFVNDMYHSLVARMDAGFRLVHQRFDAIDARFDRLEHTLDSFIETQSRANALVERRLTALERPRRRRSH